MKISTARRIIKESKKGVRNHPQELVDRAHQVCHEYHDKVSKEKAVVDAFCSEVQAKVKAEGLSDEMVAAKVKEARDVATMKVKELRQATYKEKPLMAYEPAGSRDEKGNIKMAKKDPKQHTLQHSEDMQAPQTHETLKVSVDK